MSYIRGHLKRVDAEDIGPAAPTNLAIWLFFPLVVDQILLPLLVSTFLLSASVSRHPTVTNVCCIWIIAGIVSSLLFYTGHHVGPEPPKGLCIAQASLITPVPPMASVAALSLVFYTWSTSRRFRLQSGKKVQLDRLLTICLVAAPYITYLAFATGLLWHALQHPDRVYRSRSYFHCAIDWNLYTDIMAFFSAMMCLLAAALEVHLLFMLFRSWTAVRRAEFDVGIDFQLTVRVGIFTAYILCAIGTMFSAVANNNSVLPDMFVASIGLAFFFIFATQPDVLRVWSSLLVGGWRGGRDSDQIPDSSSTPPPRCRTPVPAFDCDLLERRDSALSEKARLAALHAYYKARVQDIGVKVEVIKRPEDAFFSGKEPRRVWGAMGNVRGTE